MIAKHRSEDSGSGLQRRKPRARLRSRGALAIVSLAAMGCAAPPPRVESPAVEPGARWTELFSPARQSAWRKADFYGGTEPRFAGEELTLPAGDNLSGAVWTGPLPDGDYEIVVEAKRVEGHDIFCGLTFPIAGSHVSLILGGWGGSLCGISSFDGFDASENDTTKQKDFTNGVWYRVRLRVISGSIEAWVAQVEASGPSAEELLVDVSTEGRKLDTRFEMRQAKPLGLATWRTTAVLRGLKWRHISAQEIESAAATQ